MASLLSGRLFAQPTPTSRDCLRHALGFREDNLLSEVARRLTVRVQGQYLAYCFDRAFQCRGTAHVQARAPHLALLQHYVPDELRGALGVQGTLGYSEHTYMIPVFEQFLRGVRAADSRGTFHWLHVLLPHGPYVFDAHGGTHRLAYRTYWWDPAEYRRALGAYRRQIAFADLLLGRFLDRLDAEGLTQDAIVVVTADHGFHSLHPRGGPEWIDGFEVSAARPRVPLIIHAPGLAPGVTADDYQHVDFKRLVLGLIDGTGLPEPIAPPREKIFCDDATWFVRDAGRRWRPHPPSDARAGACGSDVEPLR